MANSKTDTSRRVVDARRGVAYILYGAVLFTSSVVTFGTAGILPGLVIPVAWGYIFFSRFRPMALLHVIVLMILGGCLLCTPAVQTAREVARRTVCKDNLHMIALALHNYHDVYGSFPPAWTTDENGRRMHSWRVLILPYLDEARLYNMFDLTQPWDSPHNLELASRLPIPYSCPSRRGDHEIHEYTSYVAVVGDNTAWPGSRGRGISDFQDGTSNTILVVEYDSGILWTEPRDLELNEALRLLAASDPEWARAHRSEDFFYEQFSGPNVAMADGSVKYAGFGSDRELWSSLLTISDGNPQGDWNVPSRYSRGASRLRIGNCIRLAVFMCLALLPMPWVWLNPNSEVDQSPQFKDPRPPGSGCN